MVSPLDVITMLSVSDVMSREAISVSEHSTMSEAADLFLEHQITGAPVVDEAGRCVGVLSASDFVHSKAEELEGKSHVGDFVVSESRTGLHTVESVGHDLVRQHMSPAVQTATVDQKLVDAARCMVCEHVHRLIVVDKRCAPKGVLTSLDVIRALVAALD